MKKNVKIGNVTVEFPVSLAPMAGVTDLPFRLLCKEMGAGLLCTEMVSAKALYYKNKNTAPLMATTEEEHPIALQLFGSEPALMADMAELIEEASFDIIDVNMGCPVPKVVNNNEGSALMKTPKLAGEILSAMVKRLKKPVTVKFRKGFNDSMVNAVEFAKVAEAAGVSAITVHGRTREQYYSGQADWEIIREVKEAVSIPVFGNGDIFSAADAKRMFEETGCDGIAVARGAKGNPWIFREIRSYLETGQLPPRPTMDEIREMLLRHARLELELKGEYTGMREMRKHVSWYTAGCPYSSALRSKANELATMEELEGLLARYLQG